LVCAGWLAAAAIFTSFDGTGAIEMGRIRIFGDAGMCVDLQASLRVALHVTKRQTGANASDRGRVTGGISGTQASHEAQC
jgi:hypothetical protein